LQCMDFNVCNCVLPLPLPLPYQTTCSFKKKITPSRLELTQASGIVYDSLFYPANE
jgi:hypothetical protein